MYLRLDGHRPVVTFDGEQTLRVAAADPPQVMLLDIGMPTQDGYDVAREVRSQPWGTDVRLIAVSGYFSPEDRERALQAGFDDLLSKPIDPHTLQRLLLAAH
jgi:CheY-like chemotaxis protein